MAKITFKAKITKVYNMDDSLAYECLRIPTFKRSHCNMPEFHNHKKYGAYSNSDLFPAILGRIKKQIFGNSSELKMDCIPENVDVDISGFLAVVSFDV